MRLVTFSDNGRETLGVNMGDSILDLNKVCPDLPSDMIGFLNLGNEALQCAQQAICIAGKEDFIPEKKIVYQSPIPRPGKILCIGHNYVGHIGIGKVEMPEYPNIFCKTTNTIIGHKQPVILPKETKQVDYEGEMAVVIGKVGKNIAEESALEYVGGYCIFNDISARDFQKRTSQWFVGKSFDSFGPLGPTLVTPDEIADSHCLNLELRVNGRVKQRANTCDMIFSIPFLIAYLSQVMTLEPGDVIATGTPAKLPEAANPQQFLKFGDVVEITIEKLGTLINTIR